MAGLSKQILSALLQLACIQSEKRFSFSDDELCNRNSIMLLPPLCLPFRHHVFMLLPSYDMFFYLFISAKADASHYGVWPSDSCFINPDAARGIPLCPYAVNVMFLFHLSENSALCFSPTCSDLFSKGYSAGRSNEGQMIREHWQSRVLAPLWCFCHMELAVCQRYYYYHQIVRWCLFSGLSWLSLAIGLITRCCCVLPGHEPTIGGHCRVGTFPCRHGCD